MSDRSDKLGYKYQELVAPLPREKQKVKAPSSDCGQKGQRNNNILTKVVAPARQVMRFLLGEICDLQREGIRDRLQFHNYSDSYEEYSYND